jgi:hypothetical protein
MHVFAAPQACVTLPCVARPPQRILPYLKRHATVNADKCFLLLPQACNDASANPKEGIYTGVGMGAEFPHLLEVSERLRENVAQLHRSVCLFMGHAWRQVLTPIQAGTFMVQAFPWTPDMLALAKTIAEEAGAPGVQDIFRDALSSQPAALSELFSC